MPYIGNKHAAGDHVNNFKVLDDISSYTATFDGSASAVVSTSTNTIRVPEHRFIQGQRVTYNNGGGGNIAGLVSGTAYFVSFDTANTIRLATSLANANNNTVINLTNVGSGTSHTLIAAFDGINKKFKLTHGGGISTRLNHPTQINVAINNVVQKPNLNNASFTEGFSIVDNHKIIFKTAPISTDIFWGSVIANTITTFDVSDHKIDTFTGDGTTTDFNLSHDPANNESIIVTINGVLQHPSNTTTSRAYTLLDNILQFTAAPANGDEIQVRHMGFAGATTADVSGFYGRTGNVVLTSNDHITTGNINAGIVTATSFVGSFSPNAGGTNANFTGIVTAANFKGGDFEGRNLKITGLSTFVGDAEFSGNVSIAGTLTYEDVTNIDSVGLVTAREGIAIPDSRILSLGDRKVGSTLGDLRIYHNGSDSYIDEVGAGNLYIRNGSKNSIWCQTDGPVHLYHNNNTKLSTSNTGVTITGEADLDNVSIAGVTTMTGMLRIDSGNLQVYGTAPNIFLRDTNDNPDFRVMNSHGSFKIFDETNGVDRFIINPSGKVSVPYDLDVDGHTNLDNVSVAGVTTFASSIHVADSIIHEGDPNTQLNFANDQFEFKNNNVRRLTIQNGNNWFYGSNHFEATSSQSKAGQYIARFRDETDHTVVHFHNTNVKNTIFRWNDYGSSSNAGNFVFTNLTGTEYARFTGSGNFNLLRDLDVDGHTNLDNVSVAGVTTFTGNANFGSNGLISSAANFSLSSNKLRVTGSDTVGIEVQRSSNATIQCTETTNNTDLQLRANATGGLVRTASNTALNLGTFQKNRIQITNDGKVQIGLPGSSTSLPGAVEVVNIRAMTDGNLHIRAIGSISGAPSGSGVGIDVLNDANNAVKDLALRGSTVIFKGASAETLRINSAGEVYIGSSTGNGQGKLFVNDSSGATTTQAHIRNAVSTGTAKVFLNLDDVKYASVGLENGNLVFRNSTSSTPTERLHITATGNIETQGLGTFEFNDGWSGEGRNVAIWPCNDVSNWFSFVGTNLRFTDGGNFVKPSDNSNMNWGNIAGIVFEGVNQNNSNGNHPAIRFVVDQPGGNGLNYSLGSGNSGKTAAIDNNTVMSISGNGNVGINRSNPDQRLNVSGNIELNAYDSANGSGGYYTSKGLIIGNAYDAGKTSTDDRNAIIWNERGLDLDFATSDTLRMKIDHTGNIGMGEDEPNRAKLHVRGADSTTSIIAKFRNPSSSASSKTKVALVTGYGDHNQDTEGHAYIGAQRGSTGNTTSLFFETSTGSSVHERMRISKDGYVTKPQTPAFFATHTGASNSIIGTLTYNTSGAGYYNNGGHLNVGTGKFTAPVNGIYTFHFHGFFQVNQSSNYFEVIFRRTNSNGAGATSLTRQYGYRDQPTNQYGPSISMHCTTYLNLGQTVEVITSGLSFHGSNGYYFGGHLVG